MPINILVVDDEIPIRTLFSQRFRHELSRGEITLDFAQSGEEALEKLADLEVILILSDINMPGMSGLELLRHIRSKHPEKPPAIIMLTAYGDANNKELAKRYGADDFLVKPIDFKLLKQIIAEIVSS